MFASVLQANGISTKNMIFQECSMSTQMHALAEAFIQINIQMKSSVVSEIIISLIKITLNSESIQRASILAHQFNPISENGIFTLDKFEFKILLLTI